MASPFSYNRTKPRLKTQTGNTGLGKEAVLQLAKHNASHIYLAARTASKAHAAVEEIKSAVPNANITFLQLDLTDFNSISKAASDFKAKETRLDVLLNNAGIMATPYSTTAQGYEIQFGTNHMGHALLTKLLLPTLSATAKAGHDVRVVNLSSEGYRMAPPKLGILFDQPVAETYNTWTRYGSAKLANILHVRGLTAHHPEITAVAVHPGVVQTDLFAAGQRASKIIGWGMWAFGGLFMQTVAQGTKNSLWACTANREEVRSGYYFTPVARKSDGNGWAKDDKLMERLWEYTEDELKKHGF